MPYCAPDEVLDPDQAACPVVGLAIDAKQHESEWHAHRRTQLLYQIEGAVTLYTAGRMGHLAPMQAVWLPAGEAHRTAMHGRYSSRSLYFDVATYHELPRASAIIEVGPLLRELIVRVTEWPADTTLSPAQIRLVGTLLDELAAAPTASLHLPMPRDRRLAAIATALLEDPALLWTLDEWATRVGASARTLARRFVMETGLTYAQWRTQCRLLVAQTKLADGASITAAAHAVGYASDSAFIAMYRRVYGEPPGKRSRVKR